MKNEKTRINGFNERDDDSRWQVAVCNYKKQIPIIGGKSLSEFVVGAWMCMGGGFCILLLNISRP